MTRGLSPKMKQEENAMAIFTNRATLSYSGGTINSNTVTGELLEVLTITKDAVSDVYADGDIVTYVVTLRNSGAVSLVGVTVTDDLGGYTFDGATVYPLTYEPGSVLYYLNGAAQAAPAVEAGPPLVFSGISVPAGGNATLVYQTRVNDLAPLGAGDTIVNTVTAAGGGIVNPVSASETILARTGADLTISKAICPAVVTDNSRLTYTFVIQNSGNTDAVATDDVIITDVFNPILTDIVVTYNGQVWTEGVNYTYDETTGLFTTLPGISVPAAAFTRNPDGTFTVTPGVATVTVTGTV